MHQFNGVNCLSKSPPSSIATSDSVVTRICNLGGTGFVGGVDFIEGSESLDGDSTVSGRRGVKETVGT